MSCHDDIERRLAEIEQRLASIKAIEDRLVAVERKLDGRTRRGVVRLQPESIELPPDTTLSEDLDYLLATVNSRNEEPFPF